MTSKPEDRYPDITDILARKAEGRRERASLTFAEKLDAVDALKARLEPVDRARKARLDKMRRQVMVSPRHRR
jgi:hypothetical protein